MKISKKQQIDLETIKYFVPEDWSKIEIIDKDITDFFAMSEKGIKKERPRYFKSIEEITGYDVLLEGKRRRGIHMEMWEDGILSGDVPYYTLLGGLENNKKWYEFWRSKHKPIPREVVNFMKREMFKGGDAKLIEHVYASLL